MNSIHIKVKEDNGEVKGRYNRRFNFTTKKIILFINRTFIQISIRTLTNVESKYISKEY